MLKRRHLNFPYRDRSVDAKCRRPATDGYCTRNRTAGPESAAVWIRSVVAKCRCLFNRKLLSKASTQASTLQRRHFVDALWTTADAPLKAELVSPWHHRP